MREKCRACKHYGLVYSPVYKSYIEDCKYTGDCRRDGCKGAYEARKDIEEAVAFIKKNQEDKGREFIERRIDDDRETKGDA